MEHLGHERATALPWHNGHTYTLLACDWRVTPLSIWFDRTQPGALTETPARPATDSPAAPLARADFDTAVRDALRDWHRPDALATGPLCTTRMVTGQPGYAAEHAGEMLRELLTDAVDALRADPDRASAADWAESERNDSAQGADTPATSPAAEVAQGQDSTGGTVEAGSGDAQAGDESGSDEDTSDDTAADKSGYGQGCGTNDLSGRRSR
ncbi:hypothetical protein ACWD4J_39785 [Streptomyces sp. NPDC002577]